MNENIKLMKEILEDKKKININDFDIQEEANIKFSNLKIDVVNYENFEKIYNELVDIDQNST